MMTNTFFAVLGLVAAASGLANAAPARMDAEPAAAARGLDASDVSLAARGGGEEKDYGTQQFWVGEQHYNGGNWAVAVPDNADDCRQITTTSWPNAGPYNGLGGCLRFRMNYWDYKVCDNVVTGENGKQYGTCWDAPEGEGLSRSCGGAQVKANKLCTFGKLQVA